DQLLKSANRALWEIGGGAWTADLAMAQLDLSEGRCSFTSAGNPEILWLRSDGWSSLIQPGQPLGVDPAVQVETKRIRLHRGDSLLIANRAIAQLQNRPTDAGNHHHLIARTLLRERPATAERVVDVVRALFGEHECRDDRSILVLKRLPLS